MPDGSSRRPLPKTVLSWLFDGLVHLGLTMYWPMGIPWETSGDGVRAGHPAWFPGSGLTLAERRSRDEAEAAELRAG